MTAPVNPLQSEDLAHVLSHTREMWEEARGRSYFITGGTGFFGMWLLESFAFVNDALGLGMQAVVLTRDPVSFAAKAPHLTTRSDLSLLAGDIRSFRFPDGAFDYLIHAAADTSPLRHDETPETMLDGIVSGTRHVLDFAVHAGVRKLLLTSSGAIYGAQPADLPCVAEEPVAVRGQPALDSIYGEGKRAAELLASEHAQQHGYELKIARCFAFVGPHLPLHGGFAMGNFIRDALQGGPIRVGGDGTPVRSYLYAADLAVWLWTLLFKATPGRAYNVGSSCECTIKQAAEVIAEMVGCEVLVARGNAPGLSSNRYVPSVQRARAELSLNESFDLRESLRRTLRWHGANFSSIETPE